MKDAVICFTGFNDRNQISELASLVHFMNGTIRKEYSPNVTHVVANHCKGEKYKVGYITSHQNTFCWLYRLFCNPKTIIEVLLLYWIVINFCYH